MEENRAVREIRMDLCWTPWINAPSFQSDGNLSVYENQTFVYEFNATDPNGDYLTYSILYGDDASVFDLNESTGVLSFISPRDFENPDDNNSDNIYEATRCSRPAS